MARIFVFRHGETWDNKNHTFSGWREVDLTPDGIKEAEGLAEKLANENPTFAYQSDLLRSQHTLKIVMGKNYDTANIITDSRIKERDYGDLTGQNKDDVEKKEPENYKLWHRSYDVRPPNGESIQDVEKRVLDFIEEEKPKWRENDIVFISAHGNSIRPIRRYFENLSIDEMCSYEYTPGEIFSYKI